MALPSWALLTSAFSSVPQKSLPRSSRSRTRRRPSGVGREAYPHMTGSRKLMHRAVARRSVIKHPRWLASTIFFLARPLGDVSESNNSTAHASKHERCGSPAPGARGGWRRAASAQHTTFLGTYVHILETSKKRTSIIK